jgi:hypothetical protein
MSAVSESSRLRYRKPRSIPEIPYTARSVVLQRLRLPLANIVSRAAHGTSILVLEHQIITGLVDFNEANSWIDPWSHGIFSKFARCFVKKMKSLVYRDKESSALSFRLFHCAQSVHVGFTSELLPLARSLLFSFAGVCCVVKR